MSYYEKYLKYKNKYLQLKNNNQIGGGPPSNHIIKGIGLFVKDSDMDNFLNPIHGFIYNQTSFIKNHKNFYIEGETDISYFIHTYFHELGEIVQPTKFFMENKIKPKDIGIILGYLYFYKQYHQLIPQLDCKITKFKQMRHKLNTNQTKSKEEINKETACIFEREKLLKEKKDLLVCRIKKFKTNLSINISFNDKDNNYLKTIFDINKNIFADIDIEINSLWDFRHLPKEENNIGLIVYISKIHVY